MTQSSKRGLFITLEGIDGTGKTTQFRLLVKYLRGRGYRVCATREPGGTRLGEQIRRILLGSHLPTAAGSNRRGRASRGPTPLAELVLMYAARAQLLQELIRPVLARGEVVVSDRFKDASLAYQGHGRGLGEETVRALDKVICGETQPDLTLVLDLAPRLALRRARGRETRRKSSRGRFEAQGLKFHDRVRAGYLALARQEPRRLKVVRADRSVAEVQAEIRSWVDALLSRRAQGRGVQKKAVEAKPINN